MGEPTPALDPSQREVALVSPGERQIVLSGPGSGKTEVVAALLRHLTEEEDLSPTQELLVISFSRAAVTAVQERTRVEGAPRVTVRTMDSLAARVLDEHEDTEDWRGWGFDRRVQRAVHLVAEHGSTDLEMLQHLVVDEVQDVVGVRAEFLLALIRALPDDAGFTLLGDPMQAVYDFQLNEKSTMTSTELLAEVRRTHDVRVRRLSGQYRSRTPEAAAVLALSAQLEDMSDVQDQARRLDAVLAGLLSVGEPGALSRLAPRWPGRTAVLCRTNGEALMVASASRQAGLDVHHQRSAQDGAATAHLARCLADVLSGTVPRDELIARAADVGVPEPERFARRVRELGGGRGGAVDVREIARRVAAGLLPQELQHQSSAPVVISTVHRAKGLEFDNVALLGGTTWLTGVEDLEASVRTTFVALTRTRDRVVTTDPLDMRRVWLDGRSGRWVRGGPRRFMTFGFEVRGSDTRWPSPPGDDAPAVQEVLASDVTEGSPVQLVLDPRLSTLELPVYAVERDGLVIGRTNHDFAEALVRRIGAAGARKGRPWPQLHGAVVEAVETWGGPAQPVDLHGGAGRWGLWLSVRLNGLVDLEW